MEVKSSTQMDHFRRLFQPDVYQLRSRHIGKYVHGTERENVFRTNCCKFAAQCA